MKFFSPPSRTPTGGWFAAACAVLLSPLAVGCASPGPPHAPSLRLPEQVKDLTAERVGDEVQLHWTTPAKTTDDLPIKGPLTAEIYRTLASATPSPTQSACTPVKRIPVQPGPSQTSDTLPHPFTLDPVALLAYRVQIFNANQRSAGQSSEAFAAAGAAPPPVEDLRATPVRAGAMIEWRPQPTTAPVELDRQLEGVPTPNKTAPPKPASKPKSKPSPKPSPKSTTKPSPKSKQPPPPPPTEAKLKAPQQATDPGGTIDRTAQFGETYRYTAQRVRAASIPGHALDLRSAASQPIVVLLKDTFPPQPPTGLAAVPGGATPAEASQASIDLSWEPDTDADLAGYNISRQPLDAAGAFTGPAIRLNATPIPSPAYSDRTAVPGQSYAYRVTAVDTVGNESAPSADIQEKLTPQ